MSFPRSGTKLAIPGAPGVSGLVTLAPGSNIVHRQEGRQITTLAGTALAGYTLAVHRPGTVAAGRVVSWPTPTDAGVAIRKLVAYLGVPYGTAPSAAACWRLAVNGTLAGTATNFDLHTGRDSMRLYDTTLATRVMVGGNRSTSGTGGVGAPGWRQRFVQTRDTTVEAVRLAFQTAEANSPAPLRVELRNTAGVLLAYGTRQGANFPGGLMTFRLTPFGGITLPADEPYDVIVYWLGGPRPITSLGDIPALIFESGTPALHADTQRVDTARYVSTPGDPEDIFSDEPPTYQLSTNRTMRMELLGTETVRPYAGDVTVDCSAIGAPPAGAADLTVLAYVEPL